MYDSLKMQYKENKLTTHTINRINAALSSCDGNYELFKQKMLTRLIRITKEDKLNVAINVLIDMGYHELAEIYKTKKIIQKLQSF